MEALIAVKDEGASDKRNPFKPFESREIGGRTQKRDKKKKW